LPAGFRSFKFEFLSELSPPRHTDRVMMMMVVAGGEHLKSSVSEIQCVLATQLH